MSRAKSASNCSADPRLCRAVIDRLTHRAHSIETGMQSIRLQDALRRQPSTASPEG